MKFCAEQFSYATDYYNREWLKLDEVLYDLCKQNPGHSTRDAVNAKLWIIGRTYATGIERKVSTTGSQGSALTQVADCLLKNGNLIDRWLMELKGTTEPLDPAKLRTIASVHGRLTHILNPITRSHQSPRSFVSKYLHFHHPSVPIYDQLAVAALRRLIRWSTDLETFAMPADGDAEYGWHLMRFLSLYEQIAAAKAPVTVKYVDNYLLWNADERAARLVIGEPK